MTGTFLPFQAGEAGNSSWNERGAIADTEVIVLKDVVLGREYRYGFYIHACMHNV
jgi:hypothetical protein